MDILLLSITVVSLIVAFIMSVVAWRLSRAERARSAARIAALAGSTRDEDSRSDTIANTIQNEPAPQPVAPSPWSTREAFVAREEFPPEAWAPTAPEPPAASNAWDRQTVRPVGTTDFGDAFLGSAVAAPPSGGRQRGLAIAASILFVAIVTGAYFTIYDGRGNAASASAATSPASDASPLELISLRHERQAGSLAITGLVRNPRAGQTLEKLAAVVFLFDQQGGFITSSRAGVDYTQLTPGDESPFVIRLDAPSNVARYRVSFRTDDGVIPHVDRRGQEPIARDLP